MLIVRGFKSELRPTPEQIKKLKQAGGTARYAYNWALARIKKKVSKTNAQKLHKEWNIWKQENALWSYEVTKCAAQEAFMDVCNAFTNFFENRAGYPKWRRRRNANDRFRVNKDWKVENLSVYIPNLGWIKLKEKRVVWDSTTNTLTKYRKNGTPKWSGRILSMTLSTKADKWFVSFNIESDINPNPIQGPTCGIDLGITTFAMISSDGETKPIESPRPLKYHEKKLKRLQKQLSKKKKGSKNREKAKYKLARQHLRTANIRKDFHHKLSTDLTKTKSIIKMETLNIDGMKQNRCLAKHINDAGWGEFQRQIKYKSYWYGSKAAFLDRWEPTSQICSCCGHKQKMPLNIRIFKCNNCGFECNRDANSATNIDKCDKYEIYVPEPYIPKPRIKRKKKVPIVRREPVVYLPTLAENPLAETLSEMVSLVTIRRNKKYYFYKPT